MSRDLFLAKFWEGVVLDRLDKLDKLDWMDRMDVGYWILDAFFSAMSPERDVAFLIGLMFKTLRWFKGLSRYAGLLMSGICSKGWVYFSAMSPERDVAFFKQCSKGLISSIPAYRQAGVQKVGGISQQCLLKGTLRFFMQCSKGLIGSIPAYRQAGFQKAW